MAHIHEKIDFTVEVFIVHKNKVLLRMHDKYKIWLSVGGHIELDEDPTEAALREVKEEVGLEVSLWDCRTWESNTDDRWRELLPPVALGRHSAAHPTSGTHEHVTLVYFARSESDQVEVSYEDDRSDDWRWFDMNELETLDTPENVRTYAKLALERLTS